MLQSAENMMGPEVPSWTLGPPSPSWIDVTVGSPPGLHKTARRWEDSDDALPVLGERSDSTTAVACSPRSLLKRSQSSLKQRSSSTTAHVSKKRSRTSSIRHDPSATKTLISPAKKRARVSKPSKQLERRLSFVPVTYEPTLCHSEPTTIAEPLTEPAGVEPTAEPLIAWSEDLTLISDCAAAAETGDDMRTVLPPAPRQDLDGMDTEEFMSEFWGDFLMDLTPPTNDSLIDAAQSFDVLSLPEPGPAAPAITTPTTTHPTDSDTTAAELTPDLAALMNGVSDDQLMELSTLLEPEKSASPAPHQPLVITPAQVSTTSVDLGALLRESEIVFTSDEPAPTTITTSAELARPSPPGSAFSYSSGVSESSPQSHHSTQSVVILSPDSHHHQTSPGDRRHASVASPAVSRRHAGVASPAVSRRHASVASPAVSRRHTSAQSCVSVSSAGSSRHASGQECVTVVSPAQSRHISGLSAVSSVLDEEREQQPQPTTHYVLVLPADLESAIANSAADGYSNQSEPPQTQPERKTGNRRGVKRSADDSSTTSSTSRRRSIAADPQEDEISAAEKYRRIRDNNNIASRRSRLQRKQRELSAVERLDELTKENTELKQRADTLERLLEQVKALAPLLTAKRQ